MVDVPEIWTSGDAAQIRQRVWFVLHVKPRTEKKAVLFLRSYGCFYHLPVYVKVTKVQRRKVKRELPLFPGYVFTKLSAEERLKNLVSPLCTGFDKEKQALYDKDVKTFRSRVKNGTI